MTAFSYLPLRSLNKPILITGGVGFIGSHLARLFREEGREVRIVDNFCVQPMIPLAGEILRKDVSDIEKSDLQDVACVYHLAASKSIPDSFQNPYRYTLDMPAASRLLEEATRAGVKRIIICSTCEVYGQSSQQPIREDAPIKPRSPYAATKAAVELMSNVYRETFGLNLTIVRLFNVFGPGERPDAVIPSFCNQLLSTDSITIEGDGNQKRDFTYVTDVVDALYQLQDQAEDCAVLNIGSGRSMTIQEVADHVLLLHGRGKKVYIPRRIQEIAEFRADTQLLRKLLGYRVKVNVVDGIRRTFEWWKDRK